MCSQEFSCLLKKSASTWPSQQGPLSFLVLLRYVVFQGFFQNESFGQSLLGTDIFATEPGLIPCSDRLFMPAKRSLCSPVATRCSGLPGCSQ